jgi:3-methyl-2-oxobutanoate hydroxymethyltransferase
MLGVQQGKTAEAAQRIIDDALLLEDAGAFAIVLEAIPVPIAKRITERLNAVTISVGAGVHCDAQGSLSMTSWGYLTDSPPSLPSDT